MSIREIDEFKTTNINASSSAFGRCEPSPFIRTIFCGAISSRYLRSFLIISLICLSVTLTACKAQDGDGAGVSSRTATTETQVEQSDRADVGPDSEMQSAPTWERLSAVDFHTRLLADSHALVLDVRTPGEMEQGVIEGAVGADFRAINFTNRIEELDLDRPVYLYCRSGNRSRQSVGLLQAAGADTIYELAGGILDWQRSGFELIAPK